ncbi:TPA: type II toxin-antitoxin system HicB family antitoxin [Methanosarcinaceae archaeon]|nr:type II toxin-antitoxin system HicB family antitoxin [Methanosarcinaceae archaeon]
MKETFTLTAIVNKKEESYESLCLELDVTSRGETIEEAVTNLKEAVELNLENEDITLPIKRPFMTTFEVTAQRKTKKQRKESQ